MVNLLWNRLNLNFYTVQQQIKKNSSKQAVIQTTGQINLIRKIPCGKSDISIHSMHIIQVCYLNKYNILPWLKLTDLRKCKLLAKVCTRTRHSEDATLKTTKNWMHVVFKVRIPFIETCFLAKMQALTQKLNRNGLSFIPVADLHSKILDARPPGGPNSFNFMQFLGIFGKIVCWRPPGELAPPPRGNPRSATAYDLLICVEPEELCLLNSSASSRNSVNKNNNLRILLNHRGVDPVQRR